MHTKLSFRTRSQTMLGMWSIYSCLFTFDTNFTKNRMKITFSFSFNSTTTKNTLHVLWPLNEDVKV